MIFNDGPWFSAAQDMAHDSGYRLEWERVGMQYRLTLCADDTVHSESGKTLDNAAFSLVQRLRPLTVDGPAEAA